MSSLGDDIKKDIYSCGRYGNALTWIISFNNESIKNSIVGKEIQIAHCPVIIIDANEELIKASFRVHLLPINFPESNVKEFFISKNITSLKITKVEKEFIDNDIFTQIYNGVFKVSFQYEFGDHEKVRAIAGPTEVKGERANIQLVGARSKCFLCNEFGHVVSACPLKEVPCQRCNKPGHIEINCKYVSSEKKCFKCNLSGHMKNNCPNKDEKCEKCSSTSHLTTGCKIQCFFCQELGHLATVCVKKKLSCNHCGKKGHLETECKFDVGKSSLFPTKRRGYIDLDAPTDNPIRAAIHGSLRAAG